MKSLAITELIEQFNSCSAEELVKQFGPEELRELQERLADIEHDQLDRRCAESIASFDAGVLYWLSNLTATDDPQWEQRKRNGEAGAAFRSPFPRNSYFVPLFDSFLNEERLFVIKSRTMVTTLSAIGFATWCAQWRNWEVLVQNKNLETAEHSMRMAAAYHANQPEWLRLKYPLVQQSVLSMIWKAGGSIRALPSGQDKVRGFHASLFLLDEAPEVVEGEESINAAHPSGARILAIGTAKPGWYQWQCER
jgi:hypothetical protein